MLNAEIVLRNRSAGFSFRFFTFSFEKSDRLNGENGKM